MNDNMQQRNLTGSESREHQGTSGLFPGTVLWRNMLPFLFSVTEGCTQMPGEVLPEKPIRVCLEDSVSTGLAILPVPGEISTPFQS